MVMVRLWPTRKHTGLGRSPARAVMVDEGCEHTGSTGNGTTEVAEVECELGCTAPAGGAEPEEPEEPMLPFTPEPELEPAPETGDEAVPAQEASTTRSPPTSSVLNPNRSNGAPVMDASPGCARFLGNRR